MKLFKTGLIASASLSLLLLGGCSSNRVDDNAVKAFGESMNEFGNMKSAAYEFDVNVSSGQEEVKLVLSGSYDAQSILRMDMFVALETQGQKMPGEIKFSLRDYILYMDMMGQKQALTFASLEPMLSLLNQEQEIPTEVSDREVELLKKTLKNASLEGDKLALEFDSKILQEELEKQGEEQYKNVTVEEVSLEAILKDKQMTSGSIVFKMKETTSKELAEVKFDFKLSNINGEVEIQEVVKEEYGEAMDAMQMLNSLL